MSSDPPSDAVTSRSGDTPDHPGRNPGEKRDNGGGRNRRRRGGPVRGRVRGRTRRRGNDRKKDNQSREIDEGEQRKDVVLSGPPIEVNGMLELAPKGFGFLRRPEKDFEQSREDVFLPPELVRREGLRLGMWIHGIAREGNRGPQLVEVTSVNGMVAGGANVVCFTTFSTVDCGNLNSRFIFK
mgnify:CR=1 FL=1